MGVRNNPVTTVCYKQERRWNSRNEALDFFMDAMMNSDGAEHDRYVRIYDRLNLGLDYCTDDWEGDEV